MRFSVHTKAEQYSETGGQIKSIRLTRSREGAKLGKPNRRNLTLKKSCKQLLHTKQTKETKDFVPVQAAGIRGTFVIFVTVC
jgi:hypothetical protein